MLTFVGPPAAHPRAGLTRRDVLRVGALGLGGLTLPGLLRARAAGTAAGRGAKDTAVVWLFLSGGPSHIDTYDPKPGAPAEYRGEFKPIRTRAPGVQVCELMPRQSAVFDRMAVVRTLGHDGGHLSGPHLLATGVPFPPAELGEPQAAPAAGAVAAKVRGPHPATGMPPYVSLKRMPTGDGPAFLGPACAPFEGHGPGRRDLGPATGAGLDRLADRRGLLKALDGMRRDLDARGTAAAADEVERQAFELVLGRRAQEAFDLDREDARVRDRYGPGLGEQLLLARRLCEAGAAFVSIEWTGGRPFGWDNHRGVFDFLRANLPALDRAVAAFVTDVADRGLAGRVLLVVLGEMGRTPKVNERAGRDHWPQAMSVALAGGGLRMAQAVGQTSAKGEFPVTRPLGAGDLLATIYHVLGIDPSLRLADRGGRPVPALADGRPIAELV
jgi:Protein of unknown function (DUF1501)